MDYNDLYFEKQGYNKDVESERVTVYSMKDSKGIDHVVMLHNESVNGPAYFHFSVEKYLKGPDGSICSIRIKDVEYEHLKNKAHNLMKKFMAPAINEAKNHIPPHIPMTCGFSETGSRRSKGQN